MILVDMNQVMVSNLMVQIGGRDVDLDEELVRHMVLNSLRSYRSKFSKEYGELIICCDDKNYWRKKIFPFYKANRKKARNESGLDWSLLFKCLNNIRDEIKEHFPYKVIQIATAEADDIIGTIVHDLEGAHLMNGQSKPVLILSGDKDFIQLQKYANVSQYDTVRKRWIKHTSPEHYLIEHIVKGDRGDGVPNILSKDDCFINGRQRPLRTKLLNTFIDQRNIEEVENSLGEHKTNWYRNRKMVDLTMVPEDIKLQVKEQYTHEASNSRDKLFPYFMSRKLKNLIEHIGDF
jgi:5'-3' exonuclease